MSDRRRFKRKLTPFLCQELLYDYVVGTLDPERKQAVEEFLPTDADTQRRLAVIKTGFIYSEKLSQFELKPSVLRRLHNAETVVQSGRRHLKAARVGGSPLSDLTSSVTSRLHLSSRALRGAGVAVCVISVIVAGLLVPWRSLVARHRHNGNAVELAPIQTAKSPVGEFGPVDVAENSNPDTSAENEDSGDEADASGDFEGKAAPPSESVAAADDSGDEGIPQNLAADQAQPAFGLQVPVLNRASPTPASQAMAAEEGDTPDRKEAAPKGFVYRASMTLDNVEDVADEITQKIEDMGGEKAGEVELGWKKGDGRYYHFAMPEANQEKLLDQLRAYGPVRISKDPHPRVMPKGRVRIILWVDAPK